MGSYVIAIQATGAHHNVDNPLDADKMAERFVANLKAAGHSVESATFTYGSRETIVGDAAAEVEKASADK